MRGRGLLVVPILLLSLTSCGYVGPVLPPSPQLPQPVIDLTAIERGDQIVIAFTTVARTTDNLAIKQFSKIDLRIGPAPVPFDPERWAAAATAYELEPPPASDPDNPLTVAVSKNIPAADWIGRRIAVAVRTAVKKNDHYSQWSNRVVLNVIAPLPAPILKAQATADGVLLTWSGGEGLEYRIYRKAATDTSALQLGVVKTTRFLDTSAQFAAAYEYTAVSVKDLVESLPSPPISITPQDIFPPSVPTGVTALAGPNSVELSWQRSPEADLKGYLVYRSVDGSAFQPIGTLVTLPAFSDTGVAHGKLYRYAISSVDQHNNPSEKSKPVEVAY